VQYEYASSNVAVDVGRVCEDINRGIDAGPRGVVIEDMKRVLVSMVSY
jgi:hypothetical protein